MYSTVELCMPYRLNEHHRTRSLQRLWPAHMRPNVVQIILPPIVLETYRQAFQ